MRDRPGIADPPTLRPASAEDAVAVARLHADSWRRHYRDAYPEKFFGPQLDDDRAAVWTQRLAQTAGTATTVAESAGELIGFVHLAFDDDPEWGTLLDNLHVRHDRQRDGIGGLLLREAAQLTLERTTGGMYLWVLEPNSRAQAFYQAMGGTEVGRASAGAPALPGVAKLRYHWPSTSLTPQE